MRDRHTDLGNPSCMANEFRLGKAWADDIESNFGLSLRHPRCDLSERKDLHQF